MSFLAPLFLLGTLVVGLPVVFHLIRRTTREVTPFSSLMFLLPTPPRVTRRSRLENLWLLLLRCLAIVLLAIGFARPFVQRAAAPPPAPGTGVRTLVLIDTSASMRREDLMAQARAKALAAVERAGREGEVAIVAFDRGTRVALSFEEWKRTQPEARAALARERIEASAPTWESTSLGPALLGAVELLDAPDEAGAARREIVVISDLQEGSRLDGLQGYEWPKGIEVTLDPVQAKRSENVRAQWISESQESSDATGIRLRVTSSADAQREQFQIRREAPEAAPVEAYVPAGQSRVVPVPAATREGERLTLAGDEVEFDNVLHVLPPQPLRIPILFIGEDAEADSSRLLYYLRRAFPKTRQQHVEIAVRGSGEVVSAWELSQAQLMILGYGVGEPAFRAAQEFARSGKAVLVPITQDLSGDALPQLLGAAPDAATEAAVKDYAMLSHLDFQHPLFAPFADPRFSDFTKIHVWRYRKLDLAKLPGARVLARFDSGDAAIVQTPLGAGSVVALATSWQPADSQLALSSKFVPLLQSLLELSSSLPPRRAQYFVGDEVPLPRSARPLSIRKPGGADVAVPEGAASAVLDEPGIYTINPDATRVVVNLHPEESRIAPLTPERLTALGIPLKKAGTAAAAAPSPSEAARARAVEIEGQQKLWRWLIVAAFVVLLSETLLAGRLARAVTPAPPTPQQS
jgi:hypothetical protein